MFGRNRRKATEHTIEAVRPLIGIFQNFNGLPAGFWRDEFALGFLGFMISFHANVTSGRNLSQEDKGQLLYDVFTALSNLNGRAIADNYVRLATQNPKNVEFEHGADNASICAFASIGKMSEDGWPYWEKAKEMAVAGGTPNDHSAIVSFLMHMLFFKPLRARFADEEETETENNTLIRRQDEIANEAIWLGKTLGANSAQEAAEMIAGRTITVEEWEKIREPWERNWSRGKDV